MTLIGYTLNGERHHLCAGSLISENFILTSAICNTRKNLDFVQMNSISLSSLNAQYATIKKFIAHDSYKTNKKVDIALVEMNEKAIFKIGGLRPACLWTEDKLYQNSAIAPGWGKTSFADHGFGRLSYTTLDLVNISVCHARLGKERAVDEIHICATDLKNEGKSTCVGGKVLEK